MSTNAALNTRVRTGPWAVCAPPIPRAGRRPRRAAREEGPERVRQYYLLDSAGRRLGIITAPTGRPTLGAEAPTVYLRRL